MFLHYLKKKQQIFYKSLKISLKTAENYMASFNVSAKFSISLQYLKKDVNNGVHFLHADKQSFYKLASLFLVEVVGHIQSTQNRKLVIFLQYLKKKSSKLLLCFFVMQNILIFYRGLVMFVVTCFKSV